MGYRTYTCPIAKSCGGCEWLAVPYPIQLERKQALVEEVLGQAVRRDHATLEKICGMDEPRGYRHKAATPFAPGSRGRVRCGFYAAGSHRIVPCSSCLVEAPGARDVLNAVARAAERCGIAAYQEDRGSGVLRHAVVRMGYATKECLLTVVTNGPRLPRAEKFVSDILRNQPQVTSIVQNVNERRTNAILGRECITLYGPGVMHDRLLGCSFEIGPTSFYQTNPQQTEVLYRLAIAGAGLAPGMRMLDAYCGTGTIGICAAHECADVEVVGVEQVGGAVAAARRNSTANGLGKRCRFVRADATEYLVAAARNGRAERFDTLIMDPPRAGSTPEFLSAVCTLGPERVSYVSCNVLTQARDVELLREGGYRLERVQPVDMFPHTKHVETVALLTRKLSNAKSIVVEIDTDTLKAEKKPPMATYANMRKWIREELGLKVSAANIAAMKDEYGLEKQFSYEDAGMAAKKRPGIPEEKRQAIIKAFEHFGLIKPKKDKD